MEMKKNPTSSNNNQPRISPAPFSSSTEREELERALLSSTGSASAQSYYRDATASSSSQQQNFVPTAVAILPNGAYDNNGMPAMAVAASVTASLPPPPARSSATASSSRNSRTSSNIHYQNQKSLNSEKNESFVEEYDDDVIVRPEPPLSAHDYQVDNYYPSAPVLPTHTSNLPSAERLATTAQLRAANFRGGLAQEEEFGDVARGQRERGAIQNHTDRNVKVANAKAARKAWRGDEGLTVDEGIHNLNNLKESENRQVEDDDDVVPYGCMQRRKVGKGGYEVKEYDTAEYDTTQYDVAEYKSVYD